MKSILFYDKNDEYFEFSNFYMAEITIDGIIYPNTEYYYQVQKFMGPESTDLDQEYAEKILAVNTSNKAYYLAKQIARGGYAASWYVSQNDKTMLNDLIRESKTNGVKPRPDWDNVKDNVMRKAVWAKFTQHPDLQQLLLDTNDAYIAENSPRDSYWGLGKDGDGKNMLGKILEEVRTLLSSNFPAAPTLNSNWIIPNVLLASAYPGSPDKKKSKIIVDKLLKHVDVVLSLQYAHETVDFNTYLQLVAPKLENKNSYCEKIDDKIFARFPVKDRGVASDNYVDIFTDQLVKAIGKGYRLLVHCWGGKGRTGTVMGILLGKIYGMDYNSVILTLENSFKSRINKGKYCKGMPQTSVQFKQIDRLLSNAKLAIVGSRDYNDYNQFKSNVDKSCKEWNIRPSSIISGGAKGADSLAERYAKEKGIKMTVYKAEWDMFGNAAGILRNIEIITAATHVIAFPSRKGKGTQNSIKLAKKRELPLKVFKID